MPNDIRPEQLRGIKSLSCFREPELAEFLTFVEVTQCPAGQTLFSQGAPGDSMYLIVEGRMRVFSSKPGGEETTIRTLEAGDAFGDVGLFHNMNRTASVAAVEDSRLIRLDRAALERMTARQGELASKFLFSLASSLTPAYSTFR
jgi:CRP/FNR family transcriptional regulator